jgi:hypothetical protein
MNRDGIIICGIIGSAAGFVVGVQSREEIMHRLSGRKCIELPKDPIVAPYVFKGLIVGAGLVIFADWWTK